MKRLIPTAVAVASMIAAVAVAAVIVQYPSSPIELRPLGDLSQGTCTNGAPPPSLGLSPVDPGGEITAAAAGHLTALAPGQAD